MLLRHHRERHAKIIGWAIFLAGPLNTARGLWERCKLPERGPVESEFGAF